MIGEVDHSVVGLADGDGQDFVDQGLGFGKEGFIEESFDCGEITKGFGRFEMLRGYVSDIASD